MSAPLLKTKYTVTIDGNEAAAYSAYRTNEVIAIYPITPSSSMGELCDEWSAKHIPNIFNTVPSVTEMQSEAGACGAIHGALQTGALATTFTSSQGLLLMIPDMFHIAAELTPSVFHVAARSVAPQGMSIYCDHSDVMATRTTGFALLCSANVQEVHDFALIAQAASLKSRIPFLHFFDGFRTSHEVSKIELLSDDEMRQMIPEDKIIAHRNRKMSPDNPFIRGEIQNSDIFFQARETVNPFYAELPKILDETMQEFTKLTSRKHTLVKYFGAKDADRVIVAMGSGAETAIETAEYLSKNNEKVGVIKVHLFMPFPKDFFLNALPKTCKAIAVLDRTKEPGALGEPLYQAITTTLTEAFNDNQLPTETLPKVIGGRFGISSKEFTPGMVKAIFGELKKDAPKNHFTIGIEDDLTFSSLSYDKHFVIKTDDSVKAIFYGLGADGTVSANKNTLKILGEEPDLFVQGYFIYDAKKSGSTTISHLRFSKKKIRATYLIKHADFIGCHQFNFIEKINILENAADNAIFLLNSHHSADKVWHYIPCELQQIIIDKKIKFYVIDAYKIAQQTGMGNRINTIMQTCYFALCNVLPKDVAIEKIKKTIQKTYANKGETVVQKNFAAVDTTLANLFEVKVPNTADGCLRMRPTVSEKAPEVVKNLIAKLIAAKGDDLPVSALPNDGTYPSNTTRWEKRNISPIVPIWSSEYCIQCGQCSIVCPHSIIRAKHYDAKHLENAPKTFQATELRNKGFPGQSFTLQVYEEDCTGCTLCVEACPVRTGNKDKPRAINMGEKEESLEPIKNNVEFFESLPENDPAKSNISTVRGVQFLTPMFEFSGACAGCGETPYVKLLSQLFGDRLIVANACGCSSVYGGSLPTVPWTINKDGRGPTWSSSLFEDNAEFGFGFRLTTDKHKEFALELLNELKNEIGEELFNDIANAKQSNIGEINQQRARIKVVREKLQNNSSPKAQQLLSVVDQLVKRSIWSLGGDGWAYDIGFGGLDHVLTSGRNINMLVLDTEVYSNTGGQSSKSTPRGAVAKFAADGKPTAKKDLGLMMMTYGNIYVASISMGANPSHAVSAMLEAESYEGPSLVIAYSHCIAHGFDMKNGLTQQKLAVKCGYWPLYRYNPNRTKEGLNPFQLDCLEPSISFRDYAYNENRYSVLKRNNPEHAEILMQDAEKDIKRRWQQYLALAKK